jgi:hypothetical protein
MTNREECLVRHSKFDGASAMSKALPRSIRLIRSPSIDGVGVFRISANHISTYYTFHEIPCEIGGRGFAVHRLGLGTLYHVRVGAVEDCSCECLGFLRYGRCRYISGLLALM